MDRIHKKVLANKTSEIMKRISNPEVLAGHLKIIFSPSDVEEIVAKFRQHGATAGTQTLLSLLEKRGPTAFSRFLDALRDPGINNDDLADELEQEERKLQGKTDYADIPMKRGNSLPLSTPCEDDNNTVHSPPPPYSAPAESSYRRYDYMNRERQSLVLAKPCPDVDITNQIHEQSSAMNSQSNEQNRILAGSLVKDIPYRVRSTIERMMNNKDVNDHNWKGLAAAMRMTIAEVQLMEEGENGKMKGLIDRMIHTKRTIKDLIDLLKTPSVLRLDVVDEIVNGCGLPTELSKNDNSEYEETDGSSQATSSRFPRQESQETEEYDTKPDARTPSQVEDDDDPKGRKGSATKADARFPKQVEDDDPKDRTSSDTKPDARIPSQVEYNDDPKTRAQSDTKPDARMPSQVEDDEELVFRSRTQQASQMPYQVNSCTVNNSSYEEDDVFDSTGDKELKRSALLISCCSKTDKKYDNELRELEGVLEDCSWEQVKLHRRCKASDLLQVVHSFLDANISKEIVSLVYLAGLTVHINGENYLLPTDLDCSTQADLMRTALNINWLVSHLSRNYLQVVVIDGAFESTMTDINLKGVLKGLAPIHPPPNAVIAFPCQPGTIRPAQERLDYLKSLVTTLKDKNMTLRDLFDQVQDKLREKNPTSSSPVEFALSSSLFSLCLNSVSSKGIHLGSMSTVTYHAIIVSNSNYDSGFINTNKCSEDCEKLRMALLKSQWECTGEICNKKAKEIIDELRKALDLLSADKKERVVMVYFMGYAGMILDCNYFFGSDYKVNSPEPLRSSVPLKWVLNLMCEKLKGPKILIVDDLNTSQPKGLVQMIAPYNVMISLPKGRDSTSYNTSFTTKFAELLEAKTGELSLKEMVQKAASFDRHHLSSSLYLN